METSERYDRQTRIAGWNQKKLDESSIYVIGSERLSDFLLADLLSLGFGKIYRVGQSDFFQFQEINPDVVLDQADEKIITSPEADRIITPENPQTIVVDCTNDPVSKFFSSRVSKIKGLKYYSASSSQNSFSFTSLKHEGELMQYHQETNCDQGLLNSMICSAILADEIRKHLMPLKTDLVLPEYEKTMDEPGKLEKKVIQIGAGATGTFAGIALTSLGADVLFVDYDTVEKSNLNRQFLFYNSIGLNKAKALAEKTREFGSGKIGFLEKKIGPNFQPKGFDFILSCVDNNDARIYMNEASTKSGTPLLNCGSSISGCSAGVYSPGNTACLSCQVGLSEFLEKKNPTKRAAGDCFNPSLIIPNQIAGAFAIKTAYDALKGNYSSWEFQSGLGVEDTAIHHTCFAGCKNKND
ncbi:MAG: ThiF family adenylyltransferase [archaeon]